MKIKPTKQHATYSCIEAKKWEITSDRIPRKVFWQRVGSDIFVTCPACSAINKLDGEVGFSGNVLPCAVCHNCQTHFFLRLTGWNGDVIVHCTTCKKTEAGREPNIKKKGWYMEPSDCDCCRVFYCPECKDE